MATITKSKKEIEEVDELPEGFEVQEPEGIDELPEGFELESESEPEEAPVKLGFGEKVADFVSGGMISEGKRIQQETPGGKEFLELQDRIKLVGQVGQSILGANVTAGALSKVPALARQPIIQGLVASAEAKAANKGIRLSNIQRAVQRYAIEGAVAAQPFDYETVGDRIKSTAIASAIAPMMGLSFESVASAITKTGRTLNKLKSSMEGGVVKTTAGTLRDPRMPSISRVRESLTEAERQGTEIGQASRKQIVEAQSAGRQEAGKVSERAKAIKETVSSETQKQTFQVKQSVKETERQINRSIDETDKLLSVESDIAAKTYQRKVTSFFRENSSAYGKELDAVSDAIASNGRMTRQEAFDVLNRTIQRSGSEAEIAESPIIQEINNLIQSKYNPATNMVDPTGTTVYRNMQDMIPFKEFLEEVRGIWKKPYASKTRFSQDEIPAAILQSEFGELVSRLPGGQGFQSLQTAYRPVISYMNKANSVLQPYKGEAYTKTAELLVKRYAKGEGAEADKQLIDFLENGTERFAKGMGAISGRARQIGENMKTLSNELGKMGISAEKRIMNIAQEGAMKISKIDSTEAKALDLIQKETDRRTALIMQEAALEESKTWARIKQLQGRKMEIQNLTSRIQKIKTVSAGAIKLLAGLTSGYLVLRGGNEIVNTIAKEQ